MCKKIVSVFCIILLLAAQSFTSSAAMLSGYLWPSRTITYSYSRSESSNFRNAVTASANAWSSKTIINYSYDSSGNGKVYAMEQYVTGVAWAGTCTPHKSGGFIDSAVATINSYYTSTYEYNKVRSVICHELGHALGMDEDWVNKKSIMWPNVSNYDNYGIYVPQTVDINYIYGGYKNIGN
ncbi:MAG: hypothetical protein HFI42_13990 [Lachnospiraceae bacterium]|nr:hypothetical protein [Lachnospiraceae bacterium]